MSTSFAPCERTSQDLGWPRLLAALAARCRTEYGQAHALHLPFLAGEAAILVAWTRIDEARALLRDEASRCDLGEQDVQALLQRAHLGGPLSGSEILRCGALAQAACATRAYFAGRRGICPQLSAFTESLPQYDGLLAEIEAVLHLSGEVRDEATAHLRSLTQRARHLHMQVRAQLDAFLHDVDFAPYLRDTYYSVRNDRYVLPIVASFQSKVPGIVHNASHTGQTLFIEPQALLGLGNDLAIVTACIDEERRRILAEVSGEIGALHTPLLAAQRRLAAVDVVFAAAALAQDLDARRVLIDAQQMTLRGARHPLLVLGGSCVVANDIILAPSAAALIISGPNAGGKTATLKTMGLCALMLRAGLMVPVAAGTAMPLYSNVVCAMGDAQDLASGRSSFSAHLAALRDIIEQAGKNALVLIDEIAANTAADEGAALGQAILEHLLEAGAWVLCTTHLEPIKALGLVDRRFVNGRVACDPQTLQPTFNLAMGLAGASYALALAGRLGLPARILARAQACLQNSGPLRPALQRLAEREAELATAQADLAERVAAHAAELAAQQAHRQQQDAEVEAARRRAYAAWQQELDAAALQAKQIMARLQAAPSIHGAQQAQRALRDAKSAALRQAGGPAATAAPAGQTLQVGCYVRVAPLGQVGQIVQIDSRGAMVALGALKMRCALGSLQVAPPPTRRSSRR